MILGVQTLFVAQNIKACYEFITRRIEASSSLTITWTPKRSCCICCRGYESGKKAMLITKRPSICCRGYESRGYESRLQKGHVVFVIEDMKAHPFELVV